MVKEKIRNRIAYLEYEIKESLNLLDVEFNEIIDVEKECYFEELDFLKDLLNTIDNM